MGDKITNHRTSSPGTHFGKQLRKARREHGWSLDELARRSGVSEGHLSRIERGLKPPTEKVALKLDGVFPERKHWFAEYYYDLREWAPPGFRHWPEYENAATHLQVWLSAFVHGLLQTEAYARALLESTGASPEVVEGRLRARMERQQRILHRDRPATIWFLIDEMCLLREVGSPEIMMAQIDHLLTVAALPHVTMSVVPSAVSNPVGSELIVAENAAYTEHVAGSYVYVDDEIVSSLGRLVTSLQAESYRASESVRMIRKARTLWQDGANPVTAMLREGPA